MRVTYVLSRSYFLLTSCAVSLSLFSGGLETPAVASENKKYAKADTAASSPGVPLAATQDALPAKDSAEPAAAKDEPSAEKVEPVAVKEEPSTSAESAAGKDEPKEPVNASDPATQEPPSASNPASAQEPGSASNPAAALDPASEKEHAAHAPPRILSPKPGQKVKINGYAEKQPATVIDPDPSDTNQPSLHRAQMRLTGSMCYACLKELQDKLKVVYGVERAKVEKTEQVSIMAASPAMSNWADAWVFYDAKRVDLIDLRAYIRTNGYFAYRVVDKEVNSVPPESQKKI